MALESWWQEQRINLQIVPGEAQFFSKFQRSKGFESVLDFCILFALLGRIGPCGPRYRVLLRKNSFLHVFRGKL